MALALAGRRIRLLGTPGDVTVGGIITIITIYSHRYWGNFTHVYCLCSYPARATQAVFVPANATANRGGKIVQRKNSPLRNFIISLQTDCRN